jgi:class 3 adenylate cyclase/tetratricopeptide (TPR) repeat protein
MKCPACEFENREEAKYCSECGARIGGEAKQPIRRGAEGERKHATVLFSDLSGYTAMSEKLDPEEVKEVMERVFGGIARIVAKYEGYIEKFIGDAVMAVFGVPKAHEDDAVRAIRAAQEIGEAAKVLSAEYESGIGRALAMHAGINTGLLVTGDVEVGGGVLGFTGDVLNVASRLCELAAPGEILVGPVTYQEAEGYFQFEAREKILVSGKEQPITSYKVMSSLGSVQKVHRLSGMQAKLVGRSAEIGELREAAGRLCGGEWVVLSVVGDAGTGKSRLIEEFKALPEMKTVQWYQGNAYSYCQNIPYFPLIELLRKVFGIGEGDAPERIREKIESGMRGLVSGREDLIPYVGSLFSLSYSEIREVSPEFWKARLLDAVKGLLKSIGQRGPTVMAFEDLHWADPSTIGLMRSVLAEPRHSVLFLFSYRPPFALFTGAQEGEVSRVYREVSIEDLPATDAQDMLTSLLGTDSVPAELRRFVQQKVEGNPFFLEEVVNSLIESEALVRENESWKLMRSIQKMDLPSTIQGVISARVDRLERESKRLLQEASVIGRSFFFEILKRVSEIKVRIDNCLLGLEQLDLIRTKALKPELEYIFKHAVTQEVVYNGLLKKERQGIHKRIAEVMEQQFAEKLPELYETLAYHYKESHVSGKAVEYLMKSGKKAMQQFSVEESHRYYQDALNVMLQIPRRSKAEDALIIDLINEWALDFYLRCDVRGYVRLFSDYKALAESLNDKTRLGRFYGWFGVALWHSQRLEEAYAILKQAIKIGEELNDPHITGYACCWFSWVCMDLGISDEALSFSEKAVEMARIIKTDHFLYAKSSHGVGCINAYITGNCDIGLSIGRELIEHGQTHSHVRCVFYGHLTSAMAHLNKGDLSSAIESSKKAISMATDPQYQHTPQFALGLAYLQTGQLEQAELTGRDLVRFVEEYGYEYFKELAYLLLGSVMVATGRLEKGLKMLDEALQITKLHKRNGFLPTAEYMIAKVYTQISLAAGPKDLSFMLKNMGAIIKYVPKAAKRAENHYIEAIRTASSIGNDPLTASAYYDLGMFYKAKGKLEQTREAVAKSAEYFEKCGDEARAKEIRGLRAAL